MNAPLVFVYHYCPTDCFDKLSVCYRNNTGIYFSHRETLNFRPFFFFFNLLFNAHRKKEGERERERFSNSPFDIDIH